MNEEDFQGLLIEFLDSCNIEMSTQLLVMLRTCTAHCANCEMNSDDFGDILEYLSILFVEMKETQKKMSTS